MRKLEYVFKCYIAHENPDSMYPYNHTHVLVEFADVIKDQSKGACHKFCWGPSGKYPNMDGTYPTCNRPHNHIRVVKNSAEWVACCKVMRRYDQECAGELADAKEIPYCVGEYLDMKGSIRKAIYDCTNPAFVNGLVTASKYREQIYPTPRPLTEDWQLMLKDKMWNDKDIFNMRTVVWIFDEVGSTGKSTFANYMWYSNPADFYSVDRFGSAADFASIIRSAVLKGWSGANLICDLARKAKRRNIYEPIECCKNGRVTVTKYEGDTINFMSSNVLVFSNFPPDVDQMSVDRWRIFEIVDKKLIFRSYTEFIKPAPNYGGYANNNAVPFHF